ncbi:MAG TPA: esterase family protein, partial [Candidatus Marinimicrobia bacterium]|nr:esterase family protein [Candidatus Neomarinimicrobiota bacterium]HQH56283.1 esterase family protein [Candidatus Neomarinimicrobiota bacterium]
LHKKLLDLKIPHVYIERPGAHTWDYWTNALEYHLLFFKKWAEKSQG